MLSSICGSLIDLYLCTASEYAILIELDQKLFNMNVLG